jgi:hypothetical protein
MSIKITIQVQDRSVECEESTVDFSINTNEQPDAERLGTLLGYAVNAVDNHIIAPSSKRTLAAMKEVLNYND